MRNFENKSIFFIGDSITEGGGFIQYLRAHFSATNRNIYLHNKGIPGGRMDMVQYSLDEDLHSMRPDYAVVALGVNDLRIMLYDGAEPLTQELIDRRQGFVDGYERSCKWLLAELKNRGITPIVCSPFCVNENIIERADIETVVDNEDKKDIGTCFYTKKTFQAINGGLKKMRDVVRAIAEELNVEFWDMYSETLANATGDCFTEDGIHYTQKGYELLAKGMLKYMYGEQLLSAPITPNIQELVKAEFDERAYYFIKYIVLHERRENFHTADDVIQETKNWLAENGNIDGVTKERELSFFRYAPQPLQNQQKLIEKIRG